jgi:hypothetical protein
VTIFPKQKAEIGQKIRRISTARKWWLMAVAAVHIAPVKDKFDDTIIPKSYGGENLMTDVLPGVSDLGKLILNCVGPDGQSSCVRLYILVIEDPTKKP